MTVTDGLKNIQPTLCSGNFYKSIDKNFLVRKHQSMRRVFLLFIGVLSCGAFMRAGDGLESLYELYSTYLGEPEHWSKAYEETKDFVKDALKEDPDEGAYSVVAKLGSGDARALGAFVHNKGALQRFLSSPCFQAGEGKFTPWLADLFRLAYRVASYFDADIVDSEDYRYVFSADSISVWRMCDADLNGKVGDIILCPPLNAK